MTRLPNDSITNFLPPPRHKTFVANKGPTPIRQGSHKTVEAFFPSLFSLQSCFSCLPVAGLFPAGIRRTYGEYHGNSNAVDRECKANYRHRKGKIAERPKLITPGRDSSFKALTCNPSSTLTLRLFDHTRRAGRCSISTALQDAKAKGLLRRSFARHPNFMRVIAAASCAGKAAEQIPRGNLGPSTAIRTTRPR